jgi:starvation-inducible DNA-binding protein
VFALSAKTKNFHWQISGQQFRDYHLLLDEQATQIFAMTDEIPERAQVRRDNDVATASLIENWIGQSERRLWFLSEITKNL